MSAPPTHTPSPLYALVDRATLDRHGIPLRDFAAQLRDGGCRLLQYRDKTSPPQEILRRCRELEEVFAGTGARLLLNDRADLASLLGWGCHVGQHDLPVHAVRQVFHRACTVGLSTHTLQQVKDAQHAQPDYIAIGPVFATSTKADAAPAVGLEGVHEARAATSLPLVAIGGITLANAASVRAAGADTVAVISGLFIAGRTVREVVADFLAVLR